MVLPILAALLSMGTGLAQAPHGTELQLRLLPAPTKEHVDLRGAALRVDLNGSRVWITPRRGKALSFSLINRVLCMDLTRVDPGRTPEAVMRWVTRRRLQPGQPLTFYLDRPIPTEYRPFVSAGVLAWEGALAAADWDHAIAVAPLPPGANADDLLL